MSNSNNVFVVIGSVIIFLITFGASIISIFKYLTSIREESRKSIERMAQDSFNFRITHEKAMGEFAVHLQKNFAQRNDFNDLYNKYNLLNGEVESLKIIVGSLSRR